MINDNFYLYRNMSQVVDNLLKAVVIASTVDGAIQELSIGMAVSFPNL